MPDAPFQSVIRSPAVVAVAAWLFPGAGYLLLGQRTRGLTVGITIVLLFFLGLLVGGVRALEVPGYNAHGGKEMSYLVPATDRDGNKIMVRSIQVTPPAIRPDLYIEQGWSLAAHPLDVVRGKPWCIPQIMIGPIDVLCSWWSVTVSQPEKPLGARSHSRVNELGILYTAIAGMLNLLAIIDASYRAAHKEAA